MKTTGTYWQTRTWSSLGLRTVFALTSRTTATTSIARPSTPNETLTSRSRRIDTEELSRSVTWV